MSEKLLPIVPGCYAIIKTSKWFGWQVYVKERAPAGDFRLPNGVIQMSANPNSWVIKSLSGKFHKIQQHTLGDGVWQVCEERCLMRIDGFKQTEQEKAREITA